MLGVRLELRSGLCVAYGLGLVVGYELGLVVGVCAVVGLVKGFVWFGVASHCVARRGCGTVWPRERERVYVCACWCRVTRRDMVW